MGVARLALVMPAVPLRLLLVSPLMLPLRLIVPELVIGPPLNVIPLTLLVPVAMLVTVPNGLDTVVMLVTRPYVSTVTTGTSVPLPYVPGVAMPVTRSIAGVVPPVLVILPDVPVTLVT